MQIGEGCLPWPMVAGHGRERKGGALMRKCVEFCGICWKIRKDWNFWKLEILWLVKEKQEKGKKEKNL